MRMRIKKRGIAALGAALLLMICLFGCGKAEAWKKWQTQQMQIDQNGQIIYCIVDSFDKNFYDVTELNSMAVKEAAEYNGKNKTGEEMPVSVLEVAMVEGSENTVRVVYQFHEDSAYAGFTGEKLYFETVEETFAAKHVFTGTVLSAGEESITLDQPTQVKLRAKHILVTDAKTVIQLPYEPLYYNSGVKVLKDGKIDTTACTDTAIIILKK